MNSITPLREENISGLIYIEFIPVQDIDAMERPWQEEIATALTFQPGKAFYSLAYSQETGGYTSPEEKNASGSIHKVVASGFTPMMQLATSAIFSEMREALFIVKMKDANGKIRLLGTQQEPMRFNFAEATPEEFGGRQGYTWTFFRDLQDNPPYYTA